MVLTPDGESLGASEQAKRLWLAGQAGRPGLTGGDGVTAVLLDPAQVVGLPGS